MRKKRDHGNLPSAGRKALNGAQRLGARVQIDDDKAGSVLPDFGEQRIGRSADAEVDTLMFCRFNNLGLKKEIVDKSYDICHRV